MRSHVLITSWTSFSRNRLRWIRKCMANEKKICIAINDFFFVFVSVQWTSFHVSVQRLIKFSCSIDLWYWVLLGCMKMHKMLWRCLTMCVKFTFRRSIVWIQQQACFGWKSGAISSWSVWVSLSPHLYACRHDTYFSPNRLRPRW